MADELDAQKTFLTWEESAEIFLTDASQDSAFYWMQLAAQQHFSIARRSLGELIVNAHAVRLFDNGKQINLERHTTADVARVNVK